MIRASVSLLICLAGLFFASAGLAETPVSGEPLKVRGDLEYPPFEFIDPDGRPTGYAVDLFRAVARASNLEVRIEMGPWPVVSRQLRDGEIHALVGLLYSQEREWTVDFSLPFLTIDHAIFVRQGSDIKSEKDLKGKKIVVQNGHIIQKYLTANGLTENMVAVDSQPTAIRLLASGKFDCFLGGRLEGMYTIWTEGIANLTTVGHPIFPRQYAFAVAQGDQELLTRLNRGLARVKASGEYKRIYDKWFYGVGVQDQGMGRLIQYGVAGAAGLLGLLGLFVFWSWSLRKQVSKQTLALEKELQEREMIKEALRLSEAQLRILINAIPDLVWMKDLNGIYRFCNPTFERFFGAKEADIIGKTDFDFVDRELARFFRDHDKRALEADGSSRNEEDLTFADGGYHGTFETVKTPVRDSSGNVLGVLGIARDISDRKNAERALRKSEKRYRAAQRMGRVGHWEYEPEGRRFWGSEEALRIYGLGHGDRNATIEEVGSCIPERGRVNRALGDLIRHNIPYDMEFEVHPADGAPPRQIHATARLEPRAEGQPIKVMGLIQDITLQKKAEADQRLLETRLRQAERMESLGNLAGGIAHDFNNILASIIGFTELALDEVRTGSSLEDSLHEIYVAGTRAKELVKQILAFARQSDDEKIPVQPARIAEEVVKFIRSTIPATIGIHKEIESRSWILGNATQIHQVLMNLCTNAAHAMEERGGTLSLGLRDVTVLQASDSQGSAPGDYVEIVVSDTGVGIPSEWVGSIFDPYFTTKEMGKGTGMGLAVTHGIVEGCGGRISVESRPGRGTTFTVHLPVTRQSSEQNGDAPEPLPMGRERILFVDDEPAITKMARQMLERLGYEVTVQTRPVDALALFRADPKAFDVVITDMTMPHLTGDELAVELFKIRPDLPIILCTGYSKTVSEDAPPKSGIKALVNKPIIKADLARTLRRVLDETGTCD